MYAVIRTGGKQYRVQEGDTLRVPTITADIGQAITFDDVLLVGEGSEITLGAESANVAAVVRGHGRDKKIIVFKKRRRKHSQRSMGHRQNFTAIQISSISTGA
ncbi:MAG: 50S ribosomal protein L21 [Mariprofundaceae bacterium]|nr:50S ribosomal protein L21 [Mariprofundaceae bacterium]